MRVTAGGTWQTAPQEETGLSAKDLSANLAPAVHVKMDPEIVNSACRLDTDSVSNVTIACSSGGLWKPTVRYHPPAVRHHPQLM